MKTGCEVGNCGIPRLKDGWRPGGMPARVTDYLPALTAVYENQLLFALCTSSKKLFNSQLQVF
jgi:hypothetical protein